MSENVSPARKKIVHDLLEPLTIIRGYADIISDKIDSKDFDDIQSEVDIITSQCRVLEARINKVRGLLE